MTITRLGILSDSHGRAQRTGRAVTLLREAGAELLIHLGDIESDAVLDELAGHRAHFVLGNTDLDERGLRRYGELLGLHCEHPMGKLEIADRSIYFTHGHLSACIKTALDANADYLLHGHSHQLRDERVDHTRIINPGALHRASRYTAAVLDVPANTLQIVEIPRD